MRLYGFKTRQGSIYAFDEEGRTLRCKQSPGKGFGEIDPPSICLFAPPEFLESIKKYYYERGGSTIALGYSQKTDKNDYQFFPFADTLSLLDNSCPVILICDPQTKQHLSHQYDPSTEPRLGFIPIERSRFTVHVGNPVSHIFYSAEELANEAPPALLKAAGIPVKPQREKRFLTAQLTS